MIAAAPDAHDLGCFVGGGTAGELMGALDWARTPVGPVSSWPQSLRTSVNICLTSRFPIVIFWGPELALLYNDAYFGILGDKHPRSLGAPMREVFPEIVDIIGPMLEGVMRSRQATWSNDQLLMLHRRGYAEECYFRFSYSPMLVEGGGVGGIFCAVTETTREVVARRRLEALEQLAGRVSEAKTIEQACLGAAAILDRHRQDVPFAVLHRAEPTASGAEPLAVAGEPPADLPDRAALWARLGEAAEPVDLAGPTAVRAILLPLRIPGESRPSGVLVAGISPHRALDDEYRGFFALMAGHVVAAIANARALETERRRVEALAEIDRAKTAFFSNISHEFRTPLALMLGHTEDALASPSRLLAGEGLETVHRNQLRLLKLVNTLLEFSRIEAGRTEATYEPTDLPTLTQDLASTFRSTIERAGLRLHVECPPLPEPVFVDREMWERIVLNLVSNAYKFTFEGAIRVALRAAGEHVELEVADTGVGVPEAELPRMFERFHRIHGARSRTHEGSGIGLALVHELVRLHGGQIRVRSRLGQGTTFTVTLPRGRDHLPRERLAARPERPPAIALAESYVAEASRWAAGPSEAEPDASAAVATEPLARSTRGARVLVADDNADMRDYLARLLRAQGWAVETVSDGVAALASARARRPDLVLTDVMMPGLDGRGLLRSLRSDSDMAGVRIILVSARAGEESRVEGLRAGADDYLVKPFASKELVARIAAHLETARLHREAELANRAKDEFLAMLGHELRNPLAPISTTLYLMRLRGPTTLEKERGILERQVGHLARLVDDLLDVSRIARGKVELDRARIELWEAVARAIETASPLLERRRHALVVAVPREGLGVHGDVDRLAQVVSNLLTNAAKYTEEGGTVTVAAERSGDEVVLRVRDTGIGIAPELLAKVFDMFTQEPQAIDRSQGGLGLGLAIVRGLVELHGGRVGVRSEGRGRGSEFTVRLPAAPAPVVVAAVAGAAGSVTAPKRGRARVMVVDDNEDAAEALAGYLAELGYVTRIAHDGPTALRLAEELVPDVALVDLGLPVMDGYELAASLRERPGLQHVRLIAVTGYGQEADQRRTQATGFEAHLVKPVDLGRLAVVLEAHADPRR